MKAGQAGLEPAGGPGASILVQEAKASSLLLHKGDFSPQRFLKPELETPLSPETGAWSHCHCGNQRVYLHFEGDGQQGWPSVLDLLWILPYLKLCCSP